MTMRNAGGTQPPREDTLVLTQADRLAVDSSTVPAEVLAASDQVTETTDVHWQIESMIESLEGGGPAWDAPLHASGSDEPSTAAIGIFLSGSLELLPDILDPYGPSDGEYTEALIPVYGGIRRDALVRLLWRVAPDLTAILNGVEGRAFSEQGLELLEDIRADAGERGFGEHDGANIEHVAYYVGDTERDLGIAPDTTDANLKRIETELRAQALAQEVVLVGSVGAFLRRVRSHGRRCHGFPPGP